MKLWIQVDGLIRRFGRIVPDAVAMFATAEQVGRRLLESRKDAQFSVAWYAVAGDEPMERAVREEDRDSPGSGAALLELFGLNEKNIYPWHRFLEHLSADSTDDPLVLTRQFETCRYCTRRGVKALRVADSGDQEERYAPYGDVGRMLEEHLRMPTARPMADTMRTGGLVAIRFTDTAQIWNTALLLLRQDPHADWITVGHTLVFYTEEPDLEDRLVKEKNVEHLSYAVNRQRMVVVSNPIVALQPLIKIGTRLLYELPQDFKAKPDPGSRIAWANLQRRYPECSTGEAGSPDGTTGELTLSLPVVATAPLFRSPVVDPEQELLRSQLNRLLPFAISADSLIVEHGARAITWMLPFAHADSDRLAVLVFDIHELASMAGQDQEKAEQAVRSILAIQHWLVSMSHRTGIASVLIWKSGNSQAGFVKRLLTADESLRLKYHIEFTRLFDVVGKIGQQRLLIEKKSPLSDVLKNLPALDVRSDEAIKPASIADGELSAFVRFDGANWIQSPDNPGPLAAIQAVLHRLLTMPSTIVKEG